MKILVLLHTTQDGTLPKIALESVTAAKTLASETDGSLVVGIVGKGAAEVAATLAGCGAVSFLTVNSTEFEQARYATDVSAVTALIEKSGADVVLAPASTRFVRSIPGAAIRAGAAVDTHITRVSMVDGQLTAQRWYYRQRIMGTFSREARPWVLMLDGGLYEPFTAATGVCECEEVAVEFTDSDQRTQVSGVQAPSSDAQTIRPDARLLFVAGAGWTKKQKDGEFHIGEASILIQEFLRRTQSSLGSSKSLVDLQSEGQETLDFMTHMNQVGQTGSTPRHPKGLATCCHGEEPHAVGWRFINERRAINLDPNCGWAQGKADVLYVGDAFEIIAKLNTLLS